MPSLLRISEAASLALHAMSVLAESPDQWLSTHHIAKRLAVSENHLSKVSQRLAHAKLVETARGPKGGMRLAKPADEITLLEVYETIDGPLETSDCLLGQPTCGRAECILGDLVSQINRQVTERLSNTTLGIIKP